MTELNFKEVVLTQLTNQLGEIELTEDQKAAVAEHLVSNGTLAVTKVVDLGDFYHGVSSSDVPAPVKSLVVNESLVYLFAHEVATSVHQEAYQAYLTENELYSNEYDYGQFLTDNELVHETTTETVTETVSVSIGKLYLNALTMKDQAEKQLVEAEAFLANVQPLISQNFIPVAE